MVIVIKDIDQQTVEDLFPPCNHCLYWEAPTKFGRDKRGEARVPENEAIEIKRGWFQEAGEKFGICGQLLYVDGEAAGYARYSPPHFLEYAAEFSRELFPPDSEGILLSCLHIKAKYQGQGLGTKLLQSVLKDLRERGYRIIETYSRDDSAVSSSGPTVLYQENGFQKLDTKRWEDATYSLMRLEL
ncbi:MAG: GNAT family N-acetyltransferase [Chloroflexi bacterium]|nr:GNAT family N-acetyltransferase [Chloroflexota bacterium]